MRGRGGQGDEDTKRGEWKRPISVSVFNEFRD